MYPKRKVHKEDLFIDIRDLDVYTDEEAIDRGIDEGDLNPMEAAFLRGNNWGNNYLEEEE